MKRSPFVCVPLNEPFGLSDTVLLKNQKPSDESPSLEKRSAPKYTNWRPPCEYCAAYAFVIWFLSGTELPL
jgi:hypothetical protein